MAKGAQRRRYKRYKIQRKGSDPRGLAVAVPELMHWTLHTEDFSSGGFRLVVPTRPEKGSMVSCSVRVSDVTLEGFKARVAWIEENFGEPPTWTVGLSLDMPEEAREHFAALLVAFLEESPEEA